MKKRLALIMAAVLGISMAAGCGTATNSGRNADGKITLEVGNWPDATRPESLEKSENWKKKFEEQNPDIAIVPNTYGYEVKTFIAKAAAGQLPDLLQNLPFTEVKSVAKNGYAADITEAAKKAGIAEAINPDIVAMCKDENGKMYTVPRSAYMQGIMINKKLFEKAGLVNADGTVKVPETFDEMADFAVQIKEKTGVSGMTLPTTSNHGGWILLNIAWNYGVEFEKQGEDGKWKATFDTPEFHKALEWIYDLNWNKGVLPDNKVISAKDMQQLLGSDQTAMIFGNSDWCSSLAQKCGMKPENLAMSKMPAGPGGRYAQLGGSLFVFSPDLTEEQIDAAFKWIEFTGFGPQLNEETYRDNCEIYANEGNFVFPQELFSIWTNKDRAEKIKEIAAPYANVDMKDFANYNQEGITLRTEPPVCAQELYSVLDSVVQEILTNKNVDIAALSKKAQSDFQANHLDKMK